MEREWVLPGCRVVVRGHGGPRSSDGLRSFNHRTAFLPAPLSVRDWFHDRDSRPFRIFVKAFMRRYLQRFMCSSSPCHRSGPLCHLHRPSLTLMKMPRLLAKEN